MTQNQKREYDKKYRENHKKEIKRYRKEHKKKRKEYNKKYSQEHIEQRKIYLGENREKINSQKRKWYQEHIEDCKKYFEKHREKYLKYRKKYHKNHKRKENRMARLREKSAFTKWLDPIPQQACCQICRKQLTFNSGDVNTSISFDHKRGKHEKIKISPARWLRIHKKTPRNIKIWESCNFGILCNRCNHFLPTKNRIKFLKRALKYAQGRT